MKIGYSRAEALKRLQLAREKLAATGSGKEPAEGELRAVAQERTAGGAGRHGVAGPEARPEARRESAETEGELRDQAATRLGARRRVRSEQLPGHGMAVFLKKHPAVFAALLLAFISGAALLAWRLAVHVPFLVQHVAVADLDGDGDQDLIAAYGLDKPAENPATRSLSVFFNDGKGAFGEPVNYDLGASPWGFVAADLDGDGDLDLAIAHWNLDGYSILINEGGGAFAKDLRRHLLRSPLQAMAAGDFDRDGRLDLAGAGGADFIGVFRGHGDGTFEPAIELAGGKEPTWLKAADLDLDGDLDLVVTNYKSSALLFSLNDGQGGFGKVKEQPLWSWAWFLSDPSP
ncbi:MAG: VCBS repeat-containing protein [Planctomycetes bacterium]|nr:VCBS repeat-containing protein [Planctomycetota bacterium]